MTKARTKTTPIDRQTMTKASTKANTASRQNRAAQNRTEQAQRQPQPVVVTVVDFAVRACTG